MADDADFRERVTKKAEAAVRERMGEGPTLSVSTAIDEGWDMTEYNAFFGDCRRAGYTASECGSVWTEAKESDVPAGGVSPEQPQDEPLGGGADDILILTEGAESSDRAATLLAESVVDGPVEAVLAASDDGQAILESLDTIPKTPAHVVSDGETVRVGDLEGLFEQELVG